jgi:hypothetical protein
MAFYSQELIRKRIVLNNKIIQVNIFKLLRCSPSCRGENYAEVKIYNSLLVTGFTNITSKPSEVQKHA